MIEFLGNNLTMPFTSRLRPICVAFVLLSSSFSVLAASDKIHYPNMGNRANFSAAEKQADDQRRIKIVNDAQNIFTLTGAEIALTRGQNLLALNTYIEVFNKSRSPSVAERAMELAFANKSYDAAEQLFTQWQKEQPESSIALRRMAWLRALNMGDYAHVAEHLPNVLAEVEDDKQGRVIFLQLAQASLQKNTLPETVYDAVQKASNKHPDWIEAQVAALLFQAATKRDNLAIQTLQNLAKLDNELSETTRTALAVIVRKHPQILAEFFQHTHTGNLPMIWQELEVEHLIQNKQSAQAYEKLKDLAEQYPEEDFAMRAAVMSHQEKREQQETLSLFNKAYQYARTQDRKSHIATLVALYLLEEKTPETQLINQWQNRIQAADYALDRYIIQMALLQKDKKPQEILDIHTKAQREGLKNSKLLGMSAYHSLYLYAVAESNLPVQQKLTVFTKIIQQNKKNLADEGMKSVYGLALYYRGLLYLDKLNLVDKGLADLRQYYQLNPDSATALNALGYSLLVNKNNLNEGFELIKKAYQKDPESPAINDSMGWAYFKKGDIKTALPYLQFAYKNEPDPEVGAHLGEVYWALGDKVKAQEIWRESWQKNKKHRALLRTLNRYKIQFK